MIISDINKLILTSCSLSCVIFTITKKNVNKYMALYSVYIEGAHILCFSLFLSYVSVFEIFARNLKHFSLKNRLTNKTNYVRSKLLPDKWFIFPTSLWKTTKQMGESLRDLWFTMLPTPSTVLAFKCKAWVEIWNISLLLTSPLFSPQKFHEETALLVTEKCW